MTGWKQTLNTVKILTFTKHQRSRSSTFQKLLKHMWKLLLDLHSLLHWTIEDWKNTSLQ